MLSACGQPSGLSRIQQEASPPAGELRLIEAPDGSLKIPITVVFNDGQAALPRLQTAVDHWRSTKTWQEAEPNCVALPWQSNLEAGPYTSYINASQIEGAVLYVSAGRYAEGGAVVPISDLGIGTRDRPFRTLQQALDRADDFEQSVAVVVSDDLYEEDLTIPPGVFLLGGFSPFDWTRHSVAIATKIKNQTSAMTFQTTSDPNLITYVDGFEIHGVVWDGPSQGTLRLEPKAQVVLSHNKFISSRGVSEFSGAVGGILSAEEAALQAHHNVFIKHPHLANATSAAFIQSTCITLVKNHFNGFINAINSQQSTGELLGNIIESSSNGIRTREESLYFEGNTIGLTGGGLGFTYALYIEALESGGGEPAIDNAPMIIDNFFLLEGTGGHGINEAHGNSDPEVLSGNHFVLFNRYEPDFPYWMFILYFDKDSPHPPKLNSYRMHHLEEVNAMTDIPENGTNTLEIVDYYDYN